MESSNVLLPIKAAEVLTITYPDPDPTATKTVQLSTVYSDFYKSSLDFQYDHFWFTRYVGIRQLPNLRDGRTTISALQLCNTQSAIVRHNEDCAAQCELWSAMRIVERNVDCAAQ